MKTLSFLVLVLAISFTGCSKENDKTTTESMNIYGKWTATQAHNGTEWDTPNDSQNGVFTISPVFNMDGSFSDSEYVATLTDHTWKLDGETITVRDMYGDVRFTYEILSLNGDNMEFIWKNTGVNRCRVKAIRE